MEAHRAVRGLKRRGELVRPMAPAAIDDQHHRFVRFAEGRHHWLEILPQRLGITVRHDGREDLGGALVDGADDTEQHAAGEATPRAGLPPRLPFASFCLCALALAQRAGGQARPLGVAPPAQPGQGKAPHARFVFREQDDLPSTCPGLQGGERKRAVGEISRSGIAPSSGTAVA